MADKHEGMRHVLDLELSERELHFIGTIVAQWGALEHEVFAQTLLTYADPADTLPKEMNSLQFSGVLELWRKRVVESAPGDVRPVLEEQYQRISHYHGYRQALVHGMWSWNAASPDKITATRIRKKLIVATHMTADALGEFALEMGEINFNIRYPRGVRDLVDNLVQHGGYLSRRALSAFTNHPVADELVPLPTAHDNSDKT